MYSSSIPDTSYVTESLPSNFGADLMTMNGPIILIFKVTDNVDINFVALTQLFSMNCVKMLLKYPKLFYCYLKHMCKNRWTVRRSFTLYLVYYACNKMAVELQQVLDFEFHYFIFQSILRLNGLSSVLNSKSTR